MLYSLILVVLWAFIGGYYAKKKGLNVQVWSAITGALGLMGLLLGVAYSAYDSYKKKKVTA